eukprot:gene6412-6643_t
MLADVARNSSYDKAIRKAIAKAKAGKQPTITPAGSASNVHVLDIGTGSGLLAMMAAR